MIMCVEMLDRVSVMEHDNKKRTYTGWEREERNLAYQKVSFLES